MANTQMFMGFLYFIGIQFGLRKKKDMSSWINLRRKLTYKSEQLTFLIRCKKCSMLPPHIKMNTVKLNLQLQYRNRLERSQRYFNKRLLNLEISNTYSEIISGRKHLYFLKQKIYRNLPYSIVNEFFKQQEFKDKKLKYYKRHILQKKFNRLLQKEKDKYNKITKNRIKRWFRNISNTNIPDNIAEIAALGKNFGVPYETKNLPINEIIGNLEQSLHTVNNDFAKEVKKEIVQEIQRHVNRNKFNTDLEKQNKSYQIMNKFQKENPKIIFLKADKGNITVAVDSDKYHDSIEDMLKDHKTYKRIDKVNVKKIEDDCNDIVKRWQSKGYISVIQKNYMISRHTNVARAYGLPKVHKPELSWRIIVSSIGSPTYKLSSYLVKILNHGLAETKSFIKDSWNLTIDLKNIILPKDYILMSLDVVALFTNVPVTRVIEAINNKFLLIRQHTKIPKSELFIAVRAVFRNTIFTFNNIIYKQKFGCPMGSPLSPVVANLVLEIIEESALKKLKFHIPLYKRYVDDILLALPNNKIDIVLKEFNEIHPRLKFTTEIEINNKISFLDLLIIRRDDGSLITNWYHKTTWSGRYLNFNSHHEFSHKIALIKGLTDRAIKLSHPTFRKKNLTIIKQTLKENEYPSILVNQTIKNRINEIYNQEHKEIKKLSTLQRIKNNTINITLPYIRDFSEKIKKIFSKKFNIGVYFQNLHNLKSYFTKHKDKLDILEQTNVVYQISCKNCNKIYIGQTLRHLKDRIKEHKRSEITGEHPTGLTRHVENCSHTFDFTKVKIMDRANNKFKREALETYHIIKHKVNSVNIQTDSILLDPVYGTIILNV